MYNQKTNKIVANYTSSLYPSNVFHQISMKILTTAKIMIKISNLFWVIEYDGQKEHTFNGIIHTLTKESKGNVDDKGWVKNTSSSTRGSNYPKKVADLEITNSHFYSNEYPWFQYDLEQ